MPDGLQATGPLGPSAGEAGVLGLLPALRATEQPIDRALWLQFHHRDPAPVAALRAAGFMLGRGDRAVRHARATAIWLGPGSWLIEPVHVDAMAAEVLRPWLEHQLEDTAHALTDVPDLWFRVRLEGNRARDLMAKGCAIDLHPVAFPPGATAVAQFARLRASIHHLEPSSGYDVCVERTLARYLWTWLADAMADYLD